jgi:DNA-directed RNA polymerase specialized sigma24 family protein/DNA-binding XRE family transcriptional regulator
MINIHQKNLTLTKSEDEYMQAWRSKEITDNQLVTALSPMLKRLASWSSDKYGVSCYKEDVFQELSIALIAKAGHSWNDSQPISSYMAGWAWRIASSIANLSNKESSFDSLYEDSELEGFLIEHSIDSHEDDILEDIDKERTKVQLLEKISLADLDNELSLLSTPPRTSKGSLSSDAKRSARKPTLVLNERLYNYRFQSGLTRVEMAEAMGLTLSKYAAYETGKTKKVPSWVFEEAQQVVNNASSRSIYSDILSQKSMTEIVKLWFDMLKLENIEDIAKILRVSVRTLRRWLYNNHKPRHSIVINYHLKVIHHIKKQEIIAI